MGVVEDKRVEIDSEQIKTSTGKWSVGLAVILIGVIFIGVILLYLPLILLGGLTGIFGVLVVGIFLFFGAHIAVVTGIIGVILGIFAVGKSQWGCGVAGLILNILILTLVGTFLGIVYHSFFSNMGP